MSVLFYLGGDFDLNTKNWGFVAFGGESLKSCLNAPDVFLAKWVVLERLFWNWELPGD